MRRTLISRSKRCFSTLSERYSQSVLYTYDRFPINIVSGDGCYFFDDNGKQYLDFGAGIAVNALGYNHPRWIKIVQDQAKKLCHVSNLYYTNEQVTLAEKLIQSCCLDKVFFCNSGTEANEAALKFTRKYARSVYKREDKTKIVTFSGSFHGRTCGSLSLTSNSKYRDPFAPLLPDAHFGTFNDISNLDDLICDRTCGVFVEPVQGEGGVYPANSEFLQKLRSRSKEVGALLVADEVQCGVGRLGKLWGHGYYDIKPDIMTIAKPLAGGLPIGAVMMTDEVASHISPGDHGTTFGGNAMICAVASETLDIINDPSFLNHVDTMGKYLHEKLETLRESPKIGHAIKDIRHCGGLMLGMELAFPVKDILANCRDNGIVFLTAGPNVIRMLPPLIVTEEQIFTAVQVLSKAIEENLPECSAN